MSAMSFSTYRSGLAALSSWGMFWLLVSCVAAGIFFSNGINALLVAWQLPEYSHGPLIPVLSAFLFVKQLVEFPINPDMRRTRWPGVAVVLVSVLMGMLGILANIDDIVAYALILWVGGMLLISWGWSTGKHFWPGVLHLVFMLPLPGLIYYKATTYLQFVSSELGVMFLRAMDVPVFLDGNIIDLGELKLHVAEACSGLRYMFPIMSFSYIFATLYRGPAWHKVTLLLAAVPIAIFMNSVRIAVAGIIVQYYGTEWLEGFSHFFEGWVIFIACILLLFALAWILMRLRFKREHSTLVDALDLDTTGLGIQVMRLQYLRPSSALILSAVIGVGAALALQTLPERGAQAPARDSFALFPRTLGEWRQSGLRERLTPEVAEVLGADDYHGIDLRKEGASHGVNLFMAWYDDQSQGGVHSPEVCLPGGGWEIAWLERSDITEVMQSDLPFRINRAIIQKGEYRMMVFYWFQQKERRIAWDFAAKYWLMVDGIRTGRTDGAMVRLTTPINPQARGDAASMARAEAEAEARLMEVLRALEEPLPRFIPTGAET